MHINLNSVPGAFSPGVVMSPGTFYGRPGEVPTFINAAVGAPLTMRGGDGDASEEGSAGVHEQAQQGQGPVPSGQRYYHNQTHGAYFYAMSSPRRKTPTGMEPKGYFDPLFFPAGVNVGSSGGGGGGGYSSSVGGSGALVNEIMKDGRAQNLDVEEGRRKGVGRGEEEETHISDDGDDEKDSGDDDDVDGDDDDSGEGESAEEGENLEAQDTDTCPSTSEDKDGDRRPNKGAGAGASFWNSSESSISRTQSLSLNVSHPQQQQQQQHTWRGLGGGEVFTDSDEGAKDAEAIQIPTKAGLGSTPIQHQVEVDRESDGGDGVELEDVTSGFGTMELTAHAHVPWKTTTISRSMAAVTATDVKEK